MKARRTVAVAAMAVAALGTSTAVVYGANDKVAPKFKVTTHVKKAPKKPVNLKATVFTAISRTDGQREDALKTIEFQFPAGWKADATGFKTCPLATIKANKADQCPKDSILFHHNGVIHAAPLLDVIHADKAPVYLTGKSGGKLTVAAYATAREIPTAHLVELGYIATKAGRPTLHMDIDKLPTVPGAHDGTNTEYDVLLDTTGPKGSILKAAKACKGSWKLDVKATFYDGSGAKASPKSSC